MKTALRLVLLSSIVIAVARPAIAQHERRLHVRAHGNAKLEMRLVKPLVRDNVRVLQNETPRVGEPIVLFVQQHDPELAKTVRELAAHHPVIVAAASKLSLSTQSTGREIQKLVKAGARRVMLWDGDRSPEAIHRALFSHDQPLGVTENVSNRTRLNEVWHGWVGVPDAPIWRAMLDATAEATMQRPRVIVFDGPPHSGKLDLLAAVHRRLGLDEGQVEQDSIDSEQALLSLPSHGKKGQVRSGSAGVYALELKVDLASLSQQAQKKLVELIENSYATTFLLRRHEGTNAPQSQELNETLSKLARTVKVPAFSEHAQHSVAQLAPHFLAEGTAHALGEDTPKIDPLALELLAEMDYPQGVRSLRAAMTATGRRVLARTARVQTTAPDRALRFSPPPPEVLYFEDLSLGPLTAGAE